MSKRGKVSTSNSEISTNTDSNKNSGDDKKTIKSPF